MPDLSKKAFWIGSGDIAARGIAFITSIYLARVLGSENFGLITLGIAVVGYMTWFSDLGMVNIGIREAAKEPERRVFRIKEIFNLKLILGLSVWFIASLITWFIPMDGLTKNILLAYMLSVIPFSLLMEWYFNGRQKYNYVAVSKIFNALIYLGLVFFMVRSASDINRVPWIYTLAVGSSSIILMYFALRNKAFNLSSRGIATYADLLRSSFILGLGWFFAQVVQLLPPVLIAAFLGLKQAGYYGAAFKFVIIGMMLDRVFVNLLLPNLSAKWIRDRASAQNDLNKVFSFIITGGAVISIFFFIEADWVTLFLFGDEYAPSAGILRWLSVFISITFINSLFSFTLIATSNDNGYLRATAISGMISIFMLFLSVFTDDITFVAATVVLAEIVITLFIYFEFKKVCDISIIPSLVKVLIISGIIALSSGLIDLPFLEGLIASLLIILMSLIFNVISIDHLKWVKERL
ncbi:oligosaccharide flippase family protein [Balneola sp. MJW-20]|uniref:oligosaccharide flippase family protein n=1 Tax=Gracilimonas aurantiaca TaxID=3234185 RepID=UPI0034652CE0